MSLLAHKSWNSKMKRHIYVLLCIDPFGQDAPQILEMKGDETSSFDWSHRSENSTSHLPHKSGIWKARTPMIKDYVLLGSDTGLLMAARDSCPTNPRIGR